MKKSSLISKKCPIFNKVTAIIYLFPPVRNASFLLIFLFFLSTSILSAQSNNDLLNRKLVWRPSEHTIGYSVEIDRLTGGTYSSHLREYTTNEYLEVSLPVGDYRFRIIPHDILDRPYEVAASPWIDFKVFHRQGIVDANIVVTGLEEDNQTSNEELERKNEELEKIKDGRRFNTLGISFGTSFIDPLFIASAHGTISPFNYFYIEAGCDFGIFSVIEEIESFFYMYPYANLGIFLPFREKGGFFAGAGAGYMMSIYVFPNTTDHYNIFAYNFTVGFNLFNFLSISYTLKTDFNSASNKLAVGYVYRF